MRCDILSILVNKDDTVLNAAESCQPVQSGIKRNTRLIANNPYAASFFESCICGYHIKQCRLPGAAVTLHNRDIPDQLKAVADTLIVDFDSMLSVHDASHILACKQDKLPHIMRDLLFVHHHDFEFTVTVLAPYSVTYNANGGTGEPSTQYKRTGLNLTLSSTQPTRDGYTFNGWNTEADGNGTSYAAGATYLTNAAVTLYAKWAPMNYTATFATGNDNTDWTIDPASGVEGTTVTVSYTGENKVKSVTVQAKQ